MKKNYVLFVLILFCYTSIYAQLGTDYFSIGTDKGSNYGGSWTNGSNNGSGFGAWSLSSTGSGGHYLGTTGQGDDSFGLTTGGTDVTDTSTAERSFNDELNIGDRFSIRIGHSFYAIGGEVALELLDDGVPVITLKYVRDDSFWQFNDGGGDVNTSQGHSSNNSLTFTYFYNDDGTYTYTFGNTTRTNLTATNDISGINGVRLTAKSLGSGQNFGANNLAIGSKYRITSSTTHYDNDVTLPNLTIESGVTLTVFDNAIAPNGRGITITGNLVNNGTIILHSGNSLIVNGTASGTGGMTAYRYIGTTNWYLISVPVSGENLQNITNDNPVEFNLDAGHYAMATYDNTQASAADRWDYYAFTDGSVTPPSGVGYSIKLFGTGELLMRGGMVNSDVGVTISDGTGLGGNSFNLVGNPYASFVAANQSADLTNNVLTVNASSLTESTIWLWDQSTSSYDQVNLTGSYYLAPGQGFFVSANGSHTFNFTKAMRYHRSTDNFQRSVTNSRPEINLVMTDGTNTRDADIFYIDGTTTGFDNGYDSSIFGGAGNDFVIYTQAVANGTGRNLGIQSLPDNNFENMIIPVGINAISGTEITISAGVFNFPARVNVYLEDKNDNSFTLLDATSDFATTLTNDLNGIGRFYLHTSSEALSIDEINLDNISIYSSNPNNLRIVGVQNGNAQVKIYSTLGKQVMNHSFDGNGVNDITLPNIRAGVYIVQLETETGKLNKKVIIQ